MKNEKLKEIYNKYANFYEDHTHNLMSQNDLLHYDLSMNEYFYVAANHRKLAKKYDYIVKNNFKLMKLWLRKRYTFNVDIIDSIIFPKVLSIEDEMIIMFNHNKITVLTRDIDNKYVYSPSFESKNRKLVYKYIKSYMSNIS